MSEFGQNTNAYPGILSRVGKHTEVFISRLSPTPENPEYAGNILRRTCAAYAGELSCQATCQMRDVAPEAQIVNAEKNCADGNLRDALTELGLETSKVLMVAVTGDKVGFADKLDEYTGIGEVKYNPEGWREIPGYNAFFSREKEVAAIGSRLADCAHLSFEFKDGDGDIVFGFEHGTRPNMFGSSDYKFEVGGRKVSYTEYVLAEAMKHYNADPTGFKIRLSSSIKPTNFVKHFASEEQRESHIPGWFKDGFAWNESNLAWQEGDEHQPDDTWLADARGLILRDIKEAMQNLGIPEEALDAENMLDPADTNGEFSSYENRNSHGDYRDLYLVKSTA
jgi:hypothetical protein